MVTRQEHEYNCEDLFNPFEHTQFMFCIINSIFLTMHVLKNAWAIYTSVSIQINYKSLISLCHNVLNKVKSSRHPTLLYQISQIIISFALHDVTIKYTMYGYNVNITL